MVAMVAYDLAHQHDGATGLRAVADDDKENIMFGKSSRFPYKMVLDDTGAFATYSRHSRVFYVDK